MYLQPPPYTCPGDEEEIDSLESRQSSFHPSTYWSNRQKLTMECPALFPPTQPSASQPSPSSALKQLHNPYEGRIKCAKQLSESPDAFLARLPPSTTDLSPDVPWIYVANPFIPRHQSQVGRGEEEEAPAEAGTQLVGFMQGGRERLELMADFVRTIETKLGKGGVKGAAVTRQVTKEREDAVADVLMLARMLKVRTGKVSYSPTSFPPLCLRHAWYH